VHFTARREPFDTVEVGPERPPAQTRVVLPPAEAASHDAEPPAGFDDQRSEERPLRGVGMERVLYRV
jgi:hypothetical protein